MTGEPLPGGFVSTVHRVGDTVRRTPPERAGFVRALLDQLAERGWSGAPRHLGTDEHGREVLSYVDGHVPLTPAERAAVATPGAVAAVGALLRELHDLTAGTALAGDREVVCHHDLSPRNTVYRAGRPVAFLDWDLAAPGDRIDDVAHCCWQFAELGRPPEQDPAAAGGWYGRSRTGTGGPTGAGWSTASCAGRRTAGAGSRPASRPATRASPGCGTPARSATCRQSSGGPRPTAPPWKPRSNPPGRPAPRRSPGARPASGR